MRQLNIQGRDPTILSELRAHSQEQLRTWPHRHDSNFDLPSQFLNSCQKNTDKVAVSDHRCQSFTYHWLANQSLAFSDQLSRTPHFQPGSHVGIHIQDSAEFIAAFYGILIAGGVVVPLPTSSRTNRLNHLVEIADVEFVVSDADPQIHLSGFENDGQSFGFDPKNLVTNLPWPCSNRTAACDLAMLMFTTGSSGDPKAVMLSHQNLISNCRSILGFLPIDKTDRAFAIAPFTHALGFSVLQTHILSGAEICIPDRKHYSSTAFDLIGERSCTSITAVPAVFSDVVRKTMGVSPAFPSLKYIAVAGGRMPIEISQDLEKQLPHAKLFVMYGQTEATARLTYLPPENLSKAAGTIGRAIPDVELKIESNKAEGTLLVRGPNVMMGYWGDLEATNRVLENGWLNTGDIVKKSPLGFFEVVGRNSELLKINGHRFHVREVEQTIRQFVTKNRFLVVPFDFYGSTRLMLFVERGNQSVDMADLNRFCREHVPSYMRPQRIKTVDSFPIHENGKIDRRSLLKMGLPSQTINKSAEEFHSNQSIKMMSQV